MNEETHEAIRRTNQVLHDIYRKMPKALAALSGSDYAAAIPLLETIALIEEHLGITVEDRQRRAIEQGILIVDGESG